MADGALFELPAHRLGVRIEMRGEDRSGGWSRSSSGRVVTRVYRWRAVAMVNGADFVGPWRDLHVDDDSRRGDSRGTVRGGGRGVKRSPMPARRKPLARGTSTLRRTELRRGEPLTRGKPLARTTMRARAKPQPVELTSAQTARRVISNNVCEIDGCGQPATQFHHRWMRSQGGTHDVWNLLHICLSCHNSVHANPEDSYRKGYMLRRVDGVEHAAMLRLEVRENLHAPLPSAADS